MPSSRDRAGGEQRAQYDHLLESVRSIPGVRSASLSNQVPLRPAGVGIGGIEFKIEGREFVEAKAPAPAEAVDLVAALKASIDAAEKSAGDGEADAESEPAPSAKKAPKKKATRTRKVAAKS